jgi:hypothetical protein
MKRFGSKYGGWVIPYPDNDLNEESIIYCVGAGEDISFDIILQSLYKCKIFLIDPTKKAKKHFEDCKNYFKDKTFRFSSNIQKDYYSVIENENPDLEKFTYIDLGLWNKKDKIKFYKQSNENYVSQSLINNFFSDNYDIVEVDSLTNIMKTTAKRAFLVMVLR